MPTGGYNAVQTSHDLAVKEGIFLLGSDDSPPLQWTINPKDTQTEEARRAINNTSRTNWYCYWIDSTE
jgi:hypothetical protein